MLYNEERKERFIEEAVRSEGSKLNARAILENIALIEHALQKDACDIDKKVLLEEASSGKYFSPNTFGVHKYMIDKYLRWCSGRRLDEDVFLDAPLYNSERKQQFIEDTIKSDKAKLSAAKLLSRIGTIEFGLSKDASRIAKSDILDEIHLLATDDDDQKALEDIYAKYIRWCNRVSGIVKNPKHLAMTLERVFSNPENNSFKFIYRSFLWLAFSGLTEEQAFRVCSDDMVFSGMAILIDGTEYPIYSESIYDLRSVTVMDTIVDNVGKKKVVLRERDRAPGREILRGLPSEDGSISTIKSTVRSGVTRAFKQAEKEDVNPKNGVAYGLNFTSVYYSGIFYRTKELEDLGVAPDFSKIVDRHYSSYDDKHGYQLSDLNYEARIRMRMEREIRNRYEEWKAGTP